MSPEQGRGSQKAKARHDDSLKKDGDRHLQGQLPRLTRLGHHAGPEKKGHADHHLPEDHLGGLDGRGEVLHVHNTGP